MHEKIKTNKQKRPNPSAMQRFLEDTHSRTRRVVEMKTLDQHFHSVSVSISRLQQGWDVHWCKN